MSDQQIDQDVWVLDFAKELILQCRFDLKTAVEMGNAWVESVNGDIDQLTPQEAVQDEIDAMMACC